MVQGTSHEALPTATGFAARLAIAVLRKRNIAVAPLFAVLGFQSAILMMVNFASPLTPRESSLSTQRKR